MLWRKEGDKLGIHIKFGEIKLDIDWQYIKLNGSYKWIYYAIQSALVYLNSTKKYVLSECGIDNKNIYTQITLQKVIGRAIELGDLHLFHEINENYSTFLGF